MWIVEQRDPDGSWFTIRNKSLSSKDRMVGLSVEGELKVTTAMSLSLKRIRAVRKELVKRGVLVDSGERCPQTGQVIWMLNPKLNEEQQRALAERPDTTQSRN
jgi:hypothetical protein